MKKVYLISNYFHFEKEKSSNRYRELAQLLSAKDNIDLEVITSRFYHRTYQHRTNLDELTGGLPYKVTFIDEMGYNKNISLARLKSSRDFARNLIKYIKSQPKPDLIYQVVPSLDCANVISKFAKENNIPLIIDVQDLWPEAFKMAINIPIISDIAFYPFMAEANSIYKRADGVCGVSQTYVDRVLKVNKKAKKSQAVYIGINLKEFDEYSKDSSELRDERIKLAYCGSLSKSYDIKLVIDALALMDNPPLFMCMGDGHDREAFQEYAKEKNVEAVFTGFIPYSQMCKNLCACDITINPIVGLSVASIINKHGDYAACGLPVINTQKSKEYCDLVEEYNMGINLMERNPQKLADIIKSLIDNPELRETMGKNARKFAEEKMDRNATYKELVNMVEYFL